MLDILEDGQKEDWPYWPQEGGQRKVWNALSPNWDGGTVVGYGGEKGSGKSFATRGWAATLCASMPVVCCIVQRTYEDLKEGHIYPLQDELKPWLERGVVEWKQTDKVFLFNNTGSRLKLQYCSQEKHLNSFQAPQYDLLFLDEAGQFARDEITYMMTSNRASNLAVQERTGYTPRTIMCFNWGGPGHKYLRRIFWDGQDTTDKGGDPADHTQYREYERPKEFEFIYGRFTDNKIFMEENPNYQEEKLGHLPEHLQQAYIDGDPDAFAGTMFEILPFAHVVDPFEVPEHYRVLGALDPGTQNCAFGLYAKSPAGNLYKVFDYWGKDKDPIQHVKAISSLIKNCRWTDGRIPEYIVSDRRAITDISGKGISSREITWQDLMRERNLPLHYGNDDRVQGAMALQAALGYEYDKALEDEEGKEALIRKPILKFFRGRTGDTIKEMRSMERDPDNPEDILSGQNIDDHLYDETRYGVLSAVSPSEIRQKQEIVDPLEGDGYRDFVDDLDDAVKKGNTRRPWESRYF